ncbi:MAG: GGDEF domain-containing protein [Oscillospiraceae bacterium]|nr:GGDEF domain-containing protein [Oscillospiraceae bacterium]
MKAETENNFFSKIFDDGTTVTNRIKYTILQWSAAVVHFLLIFIFASVGVYSMVVFNIGSTICYILCGLLVKRERYILFYYIAFVEICLHSYVATILVGWGPGFPLYIIGIMPVIFYMHFSLDESAGLHESLLIGLCCMMTFIICKVISFRVEPIYIISEKAAMYIYIFNSICAFGLLLFFSLFFLREIQVSKSVLEERNAQLDKIAGIDALTGLYNRRSMDKLLNNAAASGRTFSVIICDIDDFKKINDTYGHNSGDEVLRKLSEAIISILRENDSVCRWGGEEILILAAGTPLSGAALVAERIRSQIEGLEILSEENIIKCTVTAGAAESTEAGSVEEIIGLADDRLYSGKKSGKNKVVFE